MSDWLGISGETCVVTGALGGLGRAITAVFLEAGANVVLIDRAPADEAAALADFAAHRDQICFVAADVADIGSVEAAFEAGQAAFGPISMLVNNAALSSPKPLSDLDTAGLLRQMEVNVGGYLNCAQVLRKAGAARSIVNIASIAARNAQGGSGAYSMSKSAILMLSQQLAFEWGPEGLRTNSVSPGLFVTPMTTHFYADPADRARREAVVPLRRVGSPPDLADAVLYLSSHRAAYVNGAEIIVDGGFSQTLMSHIPRPYAKA